MSSTAEAIFGIIGASCNSCQYKQEAPHPCKFWNDKVDMSEEVKNNLCSCWSKRREK